MRRVVSCRMSCWMGMSVMRLDHGQRVDRGFIVVIANLAVRIDLVRVPTIPFGLFHI